MLLGLALYLSPQPCPDAALCVLGLSFCQLHRQQILLSGYINSTATSYLPQCQESGDYEPAQCDLQQEQCWCVDADGMEVYGTRQLGRPVRCKCLEHQHPRRGGCGLLSTHNHTWSGLHDQGQTSWPSMQKAKAFEERLCSL